MSTSASFTFGDILLRVARDSGLQKNNAGAVDSVPTANAAVFQRLKDAVNDARRDLYTAVDPESGLAYQWNCLTTMETFVFPATAGANNPAGDRSRLLVPFTFDVIEKSRWSWRTASNWAGQLQWMHPSHVDLMAAQHPDWSGHPQIACVLPMQPGNEAKGVYAGQEIRLWPAPDDEYTIAGMVRRTWYPMVSLGDIDPMGVTNAEAVITTAMWHMRRSDPDLSIRDWYKKQSAEAVARAIAMDKKRYNPGSLGVVTDGPESYSVLPVQVTHYDSVDLLN